MRKPGVPYPEGYYLVAYRVVLHQADSIAANLKKDKIETSSNREIVALIAYLQRVGRDIKSNPKQALVENKN
jgi:cytochrome c oxidase cbb3-type subunit I/II